MRYYLEFSIIAVVLVAIISTLLLYGETLVAEDLKATVAQAAAQPSAVVATAAAVQQVTESTSTPPSEFAISMPQNDVALSRPVANKVETEVKSVPTNDSSPSSLVELLHSLTNQSREQNDLTALEFDTRLSELAKRRSEEMVRLLYFSHTSPSGCDLKCRLADSNYMTLTWGENLAESTSYQMMSQDELAKMFTQKWLQSAGHRDNLLSAKFTHQGIGVVKTENRIVVTVIFAAS